MRLLRVAFVRVVIFFVIFIFALVFVFLFFLPLCMGEDIGGKE